MWFSSMLQLTAGSVYPKCNMSVKQTNHYTDALWGPMSRGVAHAEFPTPHTKLRGCMKVYSEGSGPGCWRDSEEYLQASAMLRKIWGNGQEMEGQVRPLWTPEPGVRLCKLCTVCSKVSNYNRCIKPAKHKAHLGPTQIVSFQASELSKAGRHCLQEVASTDTGAKQRLTWRWWKLPNWLGWLRCYLKKHLLF